MKQLFLRFVYVIDSDARVDAGGFGYSAGLVRNGECMVREDVVIVNMGCRVLAS